MEQEVESLAPVSNGYHYRQSVGEMEENTKSQHGGEKNAVDFDFKVE